MILLIHPPVAKPCEPPAGIARLAGMLGRVGLEHSLVDLNLEGLLYLLRAPHPVGRATDAWTLRAFRNREKNLSSMRDPGLYRNLDRYKRAVRDIGRALDMGSAAGIAVGPANYEHRGLSPLRSADLLRATEHPERNPFHPFFRSRLLDLFRLQEPRAVGVSLNYLSQALCAFSIAGLVKREFPATKLIFGGGLVTSWSRHPGWESRFSHIVDHFVAGPGERALLALLGVDPGGERAAMPDYKQLPLGRYLSPGCVLPYSASCGCYWGRCSFCPEQAEGNTYLPLPPRQVISELQSLSRETRPVLVHFTDNALSPALLDALSAWDGGVPWYGFTRVTHRLTDPDFCRALKSAGCVMLKLGIESGDPQVLDSLDKGTTVETASRALKTLKGAGIATYVYLLFGTPAENETSARRTLAFTAGHADSIDFLNLSIFNMPVAGPPEQGMHRKEFYEADLSLYTGFTHPAGWDRGRVRLFLDREFKRHAAISPILRSDPPVFTSNHAPFFVTAPSTLRAVNNKSEAAG